MPTQEQIVERFKKGTKEDHSGLWYEFSGKLLVAYLPFDYLRHEFAKPETTDKEIREMMVELNREAILKEAKEYLPFAWEKCNDERGISANRSLDHFIQWFWLAGEEDFSNKIKVAFDEDYHDYGRHILQMIENKLNEPKKEDSKCTVSIEEFKLKIDGKEIAADFFELTQTMSYDDEGMPKLEIIVDIRLETKK